MARDDRDIARMRKHFVCVRITRMNRVNLRRFQFDYDTTWNAFFLDAKLNVYSRYGGRDEGEPEDRFSKPSLLQTMREVLDVHARSKTVAKPARSRLYQPVDPGVFRPEDIPLLKRSHQGCVHCHQVREYQFLQLAHDGKFTRRRLYDWPLPENVGLVFDRSHGHRVDRLLKDSAALRAGLKPGDVVSRVNDVPVHSEYDLRWALGRAKDGKPIRLQAVRKSRDGRSRTITVELHPPKNWRETEIGWRKSLRSLPLPFGIRGYALTRSQRKELHLTEEQLAVRVVSVQETGLAGNLGLKKRDTIVALGKSSRNRTLEQLKSDMIRRFRPGDTVRLSVLRDGKRLELSGRFPDWHTDETSVP